MNENQGGNDMSGGFSTGDAVLTAAMSGGFGRGVGGGLWGGYGGYGGVGSPVFQHSIDGVKQEVENQNDCTRTLFGQAFQSINGAFENQTRNAQVSSLKDGQFAAELRTNDRLLALQAEMNANARTAADCCCALKLQAAEDKAELLAAIAAQGAKTTERELDRAEREIIFLRSQHHHPHPG